MKSQECIPRETLGAYLAGWLETDQADAIERHLSACVACEQTVEDLEREPDTLLDQLRHSQEPAEPAPGADRERDSAIGAAVARLDAIMTANQPDLAAAQLPSTEIGPYRLLRPLGHGGMGAVYLARHQKLGKLVAIKMLPAGWGANGEAAARFQREIRAAGRLRHDSIVTATDAGEQDGTHFLVMEYIDGLDLSQIARLAGPLRTSDACALVRQVALGLSHAHAEGVVHRDIKPSNLMLDPSGRVKILDFGLAQLGPWDEAAAELTSVGQMMGTLDYMAPEQAERAGDVDYRADLYSLGATLFRLLCGRAPMAVAPGLSPLEKLRLLALHAPPKVSTLQPDLPAPLVELVDRLLARQPDARPPSAAHVAEQLEAFTDGADLPALLQRARDASDAAHVALDRGRNQLPVVGSREEIAEAAAGQAPHVPRLRWRYRIAAAFLPLAVAAGILIVLETQKGQLVIESEVADVHVKIVREGRVVRDLQLDMNTASTRLSADKYEIVIDAPSDSVTIDKHEFQLKSGQTIVARIRQTAPAASVTVRRDGDQPAPAAVTGGVAAGEAGTAGFWPDTGGGRPALQPEPLYDSKPLSTWLTQLSRDRSPQAIGQALVAIRALADMRTGDEIVRALTSLLPDLNGNLTIPLGDNRNSTVDFEAFSILHQIRPGRRYCELLVEMLDKGDLAFNIRIMTSPLWPPLTNAEELDPLLDWLEARRFAGADPTSANGPLIRRSAQWLRGVLLKTPRRDDDAQLSARIVPMLQGCRALDLAFWLEYPHVGVKYDWTDPLHRAIGAIAIQAIRDEQTDRSLVCQALVLLTEAVGAAGGEQYASKDLLDAVQARLNRVAADRERLYELSPVDDLFAGLVVPLNSTVHVEVIPKGFAGHEAAGSEALLLLSLAEFLKARVDATLDVSRILEQTRDDHQKVANRLASTRPTVSWLVTWPKLEERGGRLTDIAPREWMAFLIHDSALSVAGGLPPASPPRE